MSILISAVLPIALIALVGVVLGRSFDLDIKTLSRLSIYGFVPALVLTSLVEMSLELSNAIALLAAFSLNTACLYLIALGVGRGLKLATDQRKSLIATTLFANVGNMGLPFILFSLGEAGLERAIVYLVGSSIVIASIFPIILKGDGLKKGISVTLKLPVFWAALAGIGVQFLGATSGSSLPVPLSRGATLLAEGAIPVALIMLGIQLSRTQFIFGRYEFGAAVLRLLVSPALAHSIGRTLGLDGLDLQVLTLQSAMPVAVNSLVWVTELGGDRVRVARSIVLSTLLSLATLPVILWLTGR